MNMNAETICGFYVTEKRKAVWKTELDMVKLFCEICEKNGLRYMASGGTLLGAIRHGGFIPWDDDIDLMMPRDDYERFLTLAQDALPAHYALICNRTERNYPNGHAQIRDDRTTCLCGYAYDDLKAGKNCGIFIDIFPYDHVPDRPSARKRMERKIRFVKRMCTWHLYGHETGNFLKRCVEKVTSGAYFLFHSPEREIERINRLSMRPCGQTHTVALISFMPGYERNVWDSSLFDETVPWRFEDILLPVPKRYDEALTVEFGDYRKLPDDVTGGSMHGQCYFDMDTPYTAFRDKTRAEIDALMRDIRL